jgi:ribose 5-phosphate isomerase B
LAQAILQGKAQQGILLCGSGNGVAITANKHPGIRAALCWLPELARLARQHNDANVLALPARYVSLEQAQEMVQAFLQTPFEGGRHAKRVEKIEIPSHKINA